MTIMCVFVYACVCVCACMCIYTCGHMECIFTATYTTLGAQRRVEKEARVEAHAESPVAKKASTIAERTYRERLLRCYLFCMVSVHFVNESLSLTSSGSGRAG